MFIPLLQMVGGEGENVNPEQMGNLAFLVEGLEALGILLTLQTVLVILLTFFTLKGVVKFFEGYYKVILQQIFIRKIRFSNIDLLSGYSYNSFVDSDAGRIQNTISGEVERVMQAYRSYFSAFQNGALVAVYMVLAFMSNAQFALLVMFGGALTNIVFDRFYKSTKVQSKLLTKESHAFQGLLIQKVANFKYLKASGLVRVFSEKLKNSINYIEETQRRLGFLAAVLVAMREPVIMLVVVSVILIQMKVLGGSLGLIILSLLFFYRALTFLMAVQTHWNTFLSVSGSLDNMTEFTGDLAAHQESNGSIELRSFENKIELNDLDFFYKQEHVLKNISLIIKKNETVAIVGESGSGKTTLMNILCGLLRVKYGMYHIDGTDVNGLNMATLQKRIGYITQEPVIFNDTIFNNVTFWDKPNESNIGRFENALKLAAIFDFVMEQPEKLNAPLGHNGVMISGGQKQRLSIARELYKEVDFLFLDEATSALDSETEKSIQENISLLKGKYTIIIIAHRLSTVKDADKIIYLKDGTVESIGTFDELRQSSTKFNSLVEMNSL